MNAEPLPLSPAAVSVLEPFRAKVMHSGKKAILMLPDRRKFPNMPFGETPVVIGDRRAVAKFAKIAVNVATYGAGNDLTTILQTMFGPDAGKPGTRFYVEFKFSDGVWHMVPVA